MLRLLDAPLENVITTGVTTSTVEAMEAALKRDLIAEAESGQGRVLLHDEVEEDGKFTVTAEWQDLAVASQDIMTPRDVFELMQKEGFKVNYERLPGGFFAVRPLRIWSLFTLEGVCSHGRASTDPRRLFQIGGKSHGSLAK